MFPFNHLVLHKWASGCCLYYIHLMQHCVKGGAAVLQLVQQRQFFHLLCELLQTDGGLPSMVGSVNITQIHSGRMRAQ